MVPLNVDAALATAPGPTALDAAEPYRLSSPRDLKRRIPLSPRAEATVARARRDIQSILDGESTRRLAIIGPCSVHDRQGALKYAQWVAAQQPKYESTTLLVMRVYLEKPRTGLDWTGMMNDPDICGEEDCEKGHLVSRSLLADIAELGVPIATEVLDHHHFPYISDLISYATIGARSVNHQPLRKAASGFLMPVGVKNDLYGNADPAVDAAKMIAVPQRYPGLNEDGEHAMIPTSGNRYGHVILRGGKTPNYDPESVRTTTVALAAKGLPENIVIDCSHGNSGKDCTKQRIAWRSVIMQMRESHGVVGAMLESYHREGKQPLRLTPGVPASLAWDVSATDSCSGLEETSQLLDDMHYLLQRRSS